MRRGVWILAIAGLFVAGNSSIGNSTAQQSASLQSDRWTELDLYWFDRDNIPQSVAKFLERTTPLYQNAAGRHGVIVNVGWTVDYIAGWSGDLDQRVPLLEFSPGDWWKRLAPEYRRLPPPVQRVKYAPWTYGDLRQLGEEFRRQAASKYGLNDFKFGALVVGLDHLYGSTQGWCHQHSEAFIHDSHMSGRLNPGALLRPDHSSYAEFPQGIPIQTPFYRFFARQWGSLSRAARLDALVLRDGMLDAALLGKGGPYGARPSPNLADMERWENWRASLVRETKQANPEALILGYSTAASAIAEWTVGGLDLERVAEEAYLDGWIDQSWGGGWNDYWQKANTGFTFQLANILIHGAQLAHSSIEHYVVVDTWDAWEPWDVIHTIPGKLQWEIWAYSHATVKTPKGNKVPTGVYISWMNHGSELLSPEDIGFLARNIDAATEDAAHLRDTRGPTLVYNRALLDWLRRDHSNWLGKEYIDDHAAMLLKWGVPILSATRAEWLPEVQSDMFVLPSLTQFEAPSVKALSKLLDSGNPVAIIADPAWGVDSSLAEILSSPCSLLSEERVLQEVQLGATLPEITKGREENFKVWQGRYTATVNPEGAVVYRTGSCPNLVVRNTTAQRWLYWNPPFFSPKESGRGITVDKLAPSLEPYMLSARTFLWLMEQAGHSPIDASRFPVAPLTSSFWQDRAGNLKFLFGNLERTVTGDSDTPKSCTLAIPRQMVSSHARRLTLKEVTGNGSLPLRPVGGDGWDVEVPVAPNGSSVWVLEEQ